VGVSAPVRIALPAAPGIRTGTTRRPSPRARDTRRARSTICSFSGPARSGTRPAGPDSMRSTSASATSRAATGWLSIRGTSENGPIRTKPSACSANSWNWVVRSTDHGTAPSARVRSCSRLPA
jgi:hypothetical protein